MYDSDRGIEELLQRREDETLAVAWLAERMRVFIDLHPPWEDAVAGLASFLARDDEE